MNLEMMKTAGPILAGVAAFMLLSKALSFASPGLKMAIGLIIALAAAWILLRTSMGDATGVTKFAIQSALVGTIAAGSVAALQGLGEYQHGKRKGERSEGNAALVGENGEEMVIAGNGQTYMVNEPSVVELGTQDTVLDNAETKAAMAGGGSQDLAPMLLMLQATLAGLDASMVAATNAANAAAKKTQPVIIKLNGRKVAESTVEYIKTESNLSLAPR
jgi:hypothetical protein